MTKALKNKANARKSPERSQTLARPLAPEDIRPGMRVMVLTQVFECARWSSEFGSGITVSLLNATPCQGQRPSRVVSVCLPYVLVKTGQGEPYCYDIRTVRLARVSTAFAQGFEMIAADRSASKKPEAKDKRKKDQHDKKRKS